MYFFKTIVGFLFCAVVSGCNYTDNVNHLSFYTPNYNLPGLDELLIISPVAYKVDVGKIQAEWKIPNTFPLLDKLRVTYEISLKQCHMFSMYVQCSHAYYTMIYITRVMTAIEDVRTSKNYSYLFLESIQLIKMSEIITSSISKLLTILIHLNYVPPKWGVLMLMYSKILKDKLYIFKVPNKNSEPTQKTNETPSGTESDSSTLAQGQAYSALQKGNSNHETILRNLLLGNNVRIPQNLEEMQPSTNQESGSAKVTLRVTTSQGNSESRKIPKSNRNPTLPIMQSDPKEQDHSTSGRHQGQQDEENIEEDTPGPKQLQKEYLLNLTKDARSITQKFINGCSAKLGIKFSNSMQVIDVRNQNLMQGFIKINKSLKAYYNHVVKQQNGPTIKKVTSNIMWSFRSVIHENENTFDILTASQDQMLDINWNDLKQRFQETFQSLDDKSEELLQSYMSIWNTKSGADVSLKEVFRTVVLRYVYINTIKCDNMYDKVMNNQNSSKFIAKRKDLFRKWFPNQCIQIKQSVVAAIKFLGNDSFLRSLIPDLDKFINNPVFEASNIIIRVGRQLNQQSGLLNVVAINEVNQKLNQRDTIITTDFDNHFSNEKISLKNALKYIKDVKKHFKLLDFKILDTIKKSAMNDWIQSADPV